MIRDTVIVFTGAGVSADSGVKTFRDNGGLWEGHRIEEVAHPKGFAKNPQLVWNFYKMRHDQLDTVKPNAAHDHIVKLQQKVIDLGFKFILVTQNVDRLHQAAGSTNVLELHGNLHDIKCSKCSFIDDSKFFWKFADIPLCPVCGEYLRPNIVWFSEAVSPEAYEIPMMAAKNCHSLMVVGTSLQVFPAADIAHIATRLGAKSYECNLTPSGYNANSMMDDYQLIRGRASVTVPEVCKTIINKLISDKNNVVLPTEL
jgi:NAD-dependent deacetylase